MIYCTADLHGIPLAALLRLLDRAGFGGEDTLFVLGDVIDRGEEGVALLRWMMRQPNVKLLLGNHEAMLLRCRAEPDDPAARVEWLANGGEPTLRALQALRKRDRELLLDYVAAAPLWAAVRAGGREFLLCHAGLGRFAPDRPLCDYTAADLLWNRPDPSVRYFDHCLTVFGHTPTALLDPSARGRFLRTPTWLDIDTGHPPTLLRLDDLKEFHPIFSEFQGDFRFV